MGQTANLQAIEENHRLLGKLGSGRNGKSWPVVIKFAHYNIRDVIHKNKKKL